MNLDTDTESPLVIAPVTVFSSNSLDRQYGTTYNQITLQFTATVHLGILPKVIVAGQQATVSNSSTQAFIATISVANNSPQGSVAFVIYGYKDLAGNQGPNLTSVFDSSSVIIDTVAPSIATPVRCFLQQRFELFSC